MGVGHVLTRVSHSTVPSRLTPSGVERFPLTPAVPMADDEIFREQLAIRYPSYGHAMWRPSPSNPERPVQVGDVGFIRGGNFHRLFNALLPVDDPSQELGVPEYFEPLVPKLSNHLRTDSLDRNNYCSDEVGVEPDPGYHDG